MVSDQGHNKRPLHPPGLDPRSSEAGPPPQYKDDLDERTWHYGIIAASVIFAVALTGAVIWFANTDHQTASRPQVQTTTGQSPRPATPGK
jgi:hypothetical protein